MALKDISGHYLFVFLSASQASCLILCSFNMKVHAIEKTLLLSVGRPLNGFGKNGMLSLCAVVKRAPLRHKAVTVDTVTIKTSHLRFSSHQKLFQDGSNLSEFFERFLLNF